MCFGVIVNYITTMFDLAIVLIHVSGAVAGLLAGFLAMLFRKGSGLHGAAGTVFVAAMVAMTVSAAYGAVFIKPIPLNLVVALLTLYLVVTAWRAGRRRESATGALDVAALLFVLVVAGAGVLFGFRTAAMSGPPPGGVTAPVYFVFATIGFLCAVNDVRLLRRGELSGGHRLRRHLWRMSLALLIATLSLYPGQARLFPQWLRETNLLFAPHVLLVGSMLFWGVRMRARRNHSQRPLPAPLPVLQRVRA